MENRASHKAHQPSSAAGLYVHIPFCDIRCGYCDFFTVTKQDAQIPGYLTALSKEIELYASLDEWQKLSFSTIYFGGGTPSLLTPSQLSSVIDVLQKWFSFDARIEITVETNPGTVDRSKLSGFKAAGVNRLSLGVQSFHDKELQFLDRDHSSSQSRDAVETARQAGIENISLDLIYATPGQTVADWEKTLRQAMALKPQHISAYCLTYEDGTPLAVQLRKGRFVPAADEGQRHLQLAAIEILEANGYAQYEISNFALAGFHSQHNEKYWDDSPYLGLGVSSHSFLQNRRSWNVRNLSVYIEQLEHARLPVAGDELLETDDRALEAVYLGLRQSRGLDLAYFERKIGTPFLTHYADILTKFFDRNISSESLQKRLVDGTEDMTGPFMAIEDGFLRLNREGILLCDAICSEFAR